MKKVLDDNFNKKNLELTDIEKGQLKSKIRKIEEKNWYGIILICIVIGLIFISTTIISYELGISMPIILINCLLITIHFILLFLSKNDKLIAYSGALIVFIITVILNMIITETSIFDKTVWVIAILGSYSIFIYEEFKLKRLKTQLGDQI